jgi:hypothetical protein
LNYQTTPAPIASPVILTSVGRVILPGSGDDVRAIRSS